MFRPDLSDRKHSIITLLNAHNCPLYVTPHEGVDASANPVEIGVAWNSNERFS
jgi:hypothetical protein